MQHQPLLPSRRGFLVASGLASVPALWAAPALAGTARSGAATPRTAGGTTSVALPWYDLTNQAVTAAAFPEALTQSRAWAVSWLAAARAVGRHRDPGYSTAAFAQALHDTLAAQVPSQQPQLDLALASTLAGVPEGPAKQAGIAAGRRQAAAVLAERQGDGTDTASLDIRYTPLPLQNLAQSL